MATKVNWSRNAPDVHRELTVELRGLVAHLVVVAENSLEFLLVDQGQEPAGGVRVGLAEAGLDNLQTHKKTAEHRRAAPLPTH